MVGQTLAQAGLPAERAPLCHAAKEAVFPFARFPGAEVVLSPEMKSTGEVMGLAPTPGLAYLKSQLAAGTRLPLPEPGRPAPTVLLSLCDADKPAGVAAAKRLAALGYALCATRGTATALWDAGLTPAACFRVGQGRPDALDLIRAGAVHWIVNTAGPGDDRLGDGLRIRAEALRRALPVTTLLQGLLAAVDGLAERLTGPLPPPLTLQELAAGRP